jgi:hypothetical protein
VLVSRARNACGADAIVRDGTGYRLVAAPGEVDSARLAELVRAASAVLDRDAAAAEGLAREALALTAGLSGTADGDDDPLAEVRRAAAADAAAARVILARASSQAGAHAAALPVLAAAHAQWPRDEPLLADLLRSEAAVSGPATALERFERYRRDLRERLGADPGELLQRPRVSRPQALQPAEHPQVLGGRQILVDRRVLAGDADQLADAVRFADSVHAEYPGLPGIDRQQSGEHLQGSRLPRVIRAEDAEDLALLYVKVDSVDRTEPAEGLDQAGGVNGRCSCHSRNGKRPRLHGGITGD